MVEQRSVIIRSAKQSIKSYLGRIGRRFSVRIKGVITRHEPVAEIGSFFFAYILGTVLTTLSRHKGIEVAAHLAHMYISAALRALVSPRQRQRQCGK